MALVAHALLLKQLLKSVLYYSVDQWREYGPAGPAPAGGPRQKGARKGPNFKPYSARWRLGAYFLDPAGGPKFEVTPLHGVDFVFVFQEDTFYPHLSQKDSNFKPI